MEFGHKPVLLEETIEHLNIKPDGVYVDGTEAADTVFELRGSFPGRAD